MPVTVAVAVAKGGGTVPMTGVVGSMSLAVQQRSANTVSVTRCPGLGGGLRQIRLAAWAGKQIDQYMTVAYKAEIRHSFNNHGCLGTAPKPHHKGAPACALLKP